MIEIVTIVAVIVGVTEAVKRTGYLDSRFSAIFAIALGVGWMSFAGEVDITVSIFEGVIAGLTAAGLFSGVKAVMK